MVLKDKNENPIEEGKFYADGRNIMYVEKLDYKSMFGHPIVVARSDLSFFEKSLSYPALSTPWQWASSTPLSEEDVKKYVERLRNAEKFVRSRVKENGLVGKVRGE